MSAWKAGRAVAVVLFCGVVLPLIALAVLPGGEHTVCWMNGDAVRYCEGFEATQDGAR